MNTSILNEQDYYRIVYGGWLGKNIGGTLGGPVEGIKELLELTYYRELPDGPLENDDLDLQLVWLHALEQYGPGLTAHELGQEWLEHVFFQYDEYGYALTNLRRGLLPPVAGWFNNPFNNCMGSPIRSEIWAMTAPGAPGIAARYAYHDAIVDHAGGEGVYGEMFFAALESAIFFENDRDRLIEIGMSYIPGECRTAKALKDLIRWHQEGKDWLEARSLILQHHGDENFSDTPQNIAFTILGWLYGEDFEDAILKAVNCGYDTDCTAATLGAILGMLLGAEGLPEKWANPIGDRIVVSPPIKGFPAPKNLDELTCRTIRMGKQILAAWDTGILVHADFLTSWNRLPNSDGSEESDPAIIELWDRKATSVRYLLPQGTRSCPDAELVIDFGSEGPAIGAGQRKTLHFTFTNRSLTPIVGNIALELPLGWEGPNAHEVSLQPDESFQWDAEIRASTVATASHLLAFRWTRSHDNAVWAVQKVSFSLVSASKWIVWGPEGDEGKEIYVPGNRLDWEKAFGLDSDELLADGAYRAQTTLTNPIERKVRLISAANGPIKLKLNGQVIIACMETLEFMPAYHRAPKQQWAELTLAAGTHRVEVEAHKNGIALEVYILPVAQRNTITPGSCYYHTDILLG
ncbi:ADP-ribosylglycohydrolase family protein [Paenibacillus cymbidii]|uniref:ADP-ribosylglycohydrolase family protein n=1 Tax=Paenibacillus cymbidii TaxID=1639034 RepID=UPI001081ACD1|nr:ADP-ribosylglycohydrolase family protein [Paenibacillus cymbidii]